MPGDDRKISSLACVLLVTLRLAIGWHLLYEGLWKFHSQKTAQPWSAEGYLKNAHGPLRDYFRGLTGDPNDLRWLDYDAMVEKWDDWHARFLEHYPGVNDGEGSANIANRLNLLINGPEDFRVPLEALPEGVDLKKWSKAIRFDAKAKRLIVDGRYHLIPKEREEIAAEFPLIAEPTAEQAAQADALARFHKALQDLDKLQSKLSYKERLAASLKGDPERVGVLLKDKGESGAVIEERIGEIALYQAQIERYEANLAKVKTAFQWDHLNRQWGELQALRRKLIAPVQALESELRIEAEKLLSPEQLSVGPVPERMTPVRSINLQTMWALTIIGGLLITGLLTRLAALGGAFLLGNFYMAIPPWPNCPPEPGPDHSLVVNKVFLEILALLALASLPTGRWFGMDALVRVLFYRKRPR